MRSRVAGLMLAGALCVAKAEAQIVTGPPVLYTGCVQGDLAACASFWFAYEGHGLNDFWVFTPPGGTEGGKFFWYILEDFGYTSANGLCTGGTPFYYFANDDCVVTYRDQITFTAAVARIDFPDQFRDQIVFSPAAAVAPEPATLALVAGGLAGLGAMRRRRKREHCTYE